MAIKTIKGIAAVTCLASLMTLGGCTSVPDNAGSDPSDPWEVVNRHTYAFNQGVDNVLIKPIAKGYQFIVPEPVRDSVTHFYQNLGEPSNALNNVLQGKVEEGILSLFRLMINSTVGVGGLFDVASEVGITRMPEDFGQTMGVWGISDGPYVVLPIFGPSTVRDSVGLVPEFFTDPNYYVDNDYVRWSSWGVKFVNTRERLLPYTDMLELQVDPYVAMRNAYLQSRQSAVQDGQNDEVVEEKGLLDPFADEDEMGEP